MGRDDSSLYSGLSSSTFGITKDQETRAEKRKLKTEDKQNKRVVLLPAGELVKSELQKEIDKFSNINYINVKAIIASGVPNALEIEMLSNDKTIAALRSVQARLNTILREHNDEA